MVGSSNKNNLDASKKIVEQKQKELNALKASGKVNKQAIQRAEAYLAQLRGSNDAIEAINNKANRNEPISKNNWCVLINFIVNKSLFLSSEIGSTSQSSLHHSVNL